MKISIITRPYKLSASLEKKVGTVFSREIVWLAFVGLFAKVSMHSSTMVHVLLPTLIGQLDYGSSADY